MIVYNVTVSIDEDIQSDWVAWMKKVHIPDVLATGLFAGHKFLRLLNEDTPNDGITYAVQYFCSDLGALQRYLEDYAPKLQQEHGTRYKGKFVAFRTFLEEVA